MFDYIKGKVVNILPNCITLENTNIGYLIKTPYPNQFTIDEFYTIYIYESIKEDAHELYGFSTKSDRELFLKLLSVKGLGAKAASNILGNATSNEIIDAINNSNLLFFKKIPSVGIKTSQQIIIDLKGKLKETNDPNKEFITTLSDCLKTLGFNGTEIKCTIKDLDISKYTNIQDALKDALKLLNK